MVTTIVPTLSFVLPAAQRGLWSQAINPFNMFCRNCGKEINEKAAICIHCGVSAGEGNNYCANCGAQPDPKAVVCVKCGTLLKPETKREGTNPFGSAIKTCFSKYATFSGRANRAEYWYWALFNFILGIIPVVNYIAIFALLIPSLAVFVRRMHDIGKSGWWYFISFIPLVGWVWLLILLCRKGDEGENAYGATPN